MKIRIYPGQVNLWLSASDTRKWANRPGNRWPCSDLSGKRRNYQAQQVNSPCCLHLSKPVAPGWQICLRCGEPFETKKSMTTKNQSTTHAASKAAHTHPTAGMAALLRAIDALADNCDSETGPSIKRLVSGCFERYNQTQVACLNLSAALETAAWQFDNAVSAMAKGHTVSISSLQNCAANARAVIASLNR